MPMWQTTPGAPTDGGKTRFSANFCYALLPAKLLFEARQNASHTTGASFARSANPFGAARTEIDKQKWPRQKATARTEAEQAQNSRNNSSQQQVNIDNKQIPTLHQKRSQR